MINPIIENLLDIVVKVSAVIAIIFYFIALFNKKITQKTKVTFIKIIFPFVIIGAISFCSILIIQDHNLLYVVKEFVSDEIKEELVTVKLDQSMKDSEVNNYDYAYYITTKKNNYLIFLDRNKDVIQVEKAVNVTPELIYDR
jgi:hypothetical protein